jgi:S-formylglutathione hydrolase FrmB
MNRFISGERVMRRCCAALIAVLAFGLSLSTPASEIVSREFAAATLARPWAYEVYVPSHYDSSKLAYPVLYLLHGNNGNRHDWVRLGKIQATADALIARGDIPPAIIVMPDAGATWFVDRREKMETAVIRDLIADVEKNFRALRAREGRLIGGLSMGGYGSLRFALKYPEMFAAAALLSPAIYDPLPPKNSGARRVGTFGAPDFDETVWRSLNYPTLWDAYLAKKIAVPMYINSGDDDEFYIEAEAVKLYSLLRANQQPAELRIVNGAHSWTVWAGTIGDAMKYVFRYAAKPAAVK